VEPFEVSHRKDIDIIFSRLGSLVRIGVTQTPFRNVLLITRKLSYEAKTGASNGCTPNPQISRLVQSEQFETELHVYFTESPLGCVASNLTCNYKRIDWGSRVGATTKQTLPNGNWWETSNPCGDPNGVDNRRLTGDRIIGP